MNVHHVAQHSQLKAQRLKVHRGALIPGVHSRDVNKVEEESPVCDGRHLRCTGEGIANEDNGPDAMFSLAAMKGAKAAQKVAEAAVPDNAEAAAESSSESSGSDDGGSSSDEDSDDARRWELCRALCCCST